MPKRRQRKEVRKVPQLPEGGGSVALTVEERRAKLEVMLTDFDNEVEERIEMMYKAGQDKCTALARRSKLQILKIPTKIRNMKMVDFIALGGSVESVVKALSGADDNSLQQKIQQITSGRKKGKKRMAIEPLTINPEEGGSTVKKARRATVKNKPSFSQKQTTGPTRRKSVRHQFKTPHMRSGMRGQGFDTPLVTPKFDPRLPMTPTTCRRAKKGEVLMSMAGSPIVDRWSNNDVQILLPTPGGETLSLTADPNTDVPLSHMDAETVAKMKAIQEKLARMLGK